MVSYKSNEQHGALAEVLSGHGKWESTGTAEIIQ